ncbi:hypothetical protein [Endozoicomonas sp. Mp262]|uniref:hypothetical protein n=1 Tax=Endozoicomonas sp. Mp262 TaxID=2919499 RepID=UPI0021D9612A
MWDTSEDSPSYLSKNSGILYGRYSQNIIIFDDIAEYPSNLSTFSGMTSGTKEPIKMLLMEEDELPQTYTTHTHCDFLNYSKFTLDNNHYLIELNGYAVNSRDFISVYEYSYRDIFSTEYDIKIAIDDFIYACSDTQLFLLVIPKRNKNKVVVTSKNPENIEKSTTRHSLLFGGKIEEDRSSINSTVSAKDTFQNFTFINGDFEKVN